jgi:hypothetical protein
MAIPPEPLEELIADARSIVLGKVVAIVSTGPMPPQRKKTHPGEVDIGNKKPSQRVKLSVERVLKGPAPSEIEIDKPESGYTLEVGETGPFFIGEGKIIGRYGPATHTLAKIEAALKR